MLPNSPGEVFVVSAKRQVIDAKRGIIHRETAFEIINDALETEEVDGLIINNLLHPDNKVYGVHFEVRNMYGANNTILFNFDFEAGVFKGKLFEGYHEMEFRNKICDLLHNNVSDENLIGTISDFYDVSNVEVPFATLISTLPPKRSIRLDGMDISAIQFIHALRQIYMLKDAKPVGGNLVVEDNIYGDFTINAHRPQVINDIWKRIQSKAYDVDDCHELVKRFLNYEIDFGLFFDDNGDLV